MVESENNRYTWMDPLIDKITENFGVDLKSVRYEVSVPSNSFYLSNMLFVNITARSNDQGGKKMSIQVVVKKPPLSESLRAMARTDEQFHNEIIFYEKYGKGHPEFPCCLYAEEKPPIDSVIVLENVVAQRGYDVTRWKYEIPLEYTLAAFREIALFHANAYAMKEQRRDDFFDMVKNIRESRYFPDSNMKVIINGTATRSVEYLRKQGYEQGFCDKLEDYLGNTYENVMLKAIQPDEPLATLCHGDWTLNNTLYKRENGELKAMFIDFALMRFGSPVLDLSTFLCLHCAKELDKDMLGNVLKVYHDSLEKCLIENGVDCEKYSYEALYEDYKRKGLFGFFIATFFLAMQMGKATVDLQALTDMQPHECAQQLREMGGDEISEILANMLLKLKDFGCFDHIL
ncbi:hypothetical protein WH47_05562 [Habropoda laboriosa]|uniref:CHK kinase-like domain-containing protein n=1 Tax=Habropoda laboriosa TaxID=597456 RepID=A0A0L7RFL6_9HYME|nr:PREDICTED: uncharacterized protein LOC108578743 [Habropoda laboriosa]KOC69619.1 hypothetical protein WH47_05562 [Habropoda laboriosa]